MKSFEVNLTLRLYDTALVATIEKMYKEGGERYESKNHFLTQLIKIGIETVQGKSIGKNNVKEFTEMPNEYAESIGQIQRLFQDMHNHNKNQVELLLAHLSISEKMSAAIYHMLLAIIEDESISKFHLENGFYDDLPQRLISEMQKLLKDISIRFKSDE